MALKHTIELRLPRLFGRKKNDEGGEVRTEVNLEDKEKYFIIGGVLLAGLVVGYLVGHHRGVGKAQPQVLVVK